MRLMVPFISTAHSGVPGSPMSRLDPPPFCGANFPRNTPPAQVEAAPRQEAAMVREFRDQVGKGIAVLALEGRGTAETEKEVVPQVQAVDV